MENETTTMTNEIKVGLLRDHAREMLLEADRLCKNASRNESLTTLSLEKAATLASTSSYIQTALIDQVQLLESIHKEAINTEISHREQFMVS